MKIEIIDTNSKALTTSTKSTKPMKIDIIDTNRLKTDQIDKTDEIVQN